MGFAADVEMLAVNVERTAQREVQHPRRHGRVGQLVDQNEAPQSAVGRAAVHRVGLECDLTVGRDLRHADAVQPSVFAARCSKVLTFTSYLGACTVAVTICVPSFSQ